MSNDVEFLKQVYQRFNARDIEAVLAALHSDVTWANGMEEGTFTAGKPCGAIGPDNGRRSTRASSRPPFQPAPMARSSSRSTRRCATSRERCWLTRWSVTSSGSRMA